MRLGDLSALVRDVKARIEATQGLDGSRVNKFRDYLSLDLMKLEAEQAFLGAQAEVLSAVLQEEPAP